MQKQCLIDRELSKVVVIDHERLNNVELAKCKDVYHSTIWTLHT